MVSNQQNLNQMEIDEFLRTLRSLGIKKDDISGEPLKIKYSNVTPYSTHQRHSTPTKYKNEEKDDDDDNLRPPNDKHRVYEYKKTSASSLLQKGKTNVHKPPGRKPNILYVY